MCVIKKKKKEEKKRLKKSMWEKTNWDTTVVSLNFVKDKGWCCSCIDMASIANMLFPPETPTTIPTWGTTISDNDNCGLQEDTYPPTGLSISSLFILICPNYCCGHLSEEERTGQLGSCNRWSPIKRFCSNVPCSCRSVSTHVWVLLT